MNRKEILEVEWIEGIAGGGRFERSMEKYLKARLTSKSENKIPTRKNRRMGHPAVWRGALMKGRRKDKVETRK
jgi:hypothetical protein